MIFDWGGNTFSGGLAGVFGWSGLTTGTSPVTLFTGDAITPATGVTDRVTGITFILQGTAAPGASVPVEIGTAGVGVDFCATGNTLGPVQSLATNRDQTLQLTITYGAGTAANTVSLRQLVVEVLSG